MHSTLTGLKFRQSTKAMAAMVSPVAGFDLPTALDWSGHSTLEPSPEIPVCLLTVDQLRPASGYKMADTLSDMAQAAAQIRVDTGRGDSFHRLPSLSAIVLNLISLVVACLNRGAPGSMELCEKATDVCDRRFVFHKVLLKFPTILTIVFATNCLGSLSNVYKRAHQEVDCWNLASDTDQRWNLLCSTSWCHVLGVFCDDCLTGAF